MIYTNEVDLIFEGLKTQLDNIHKLENSKPSLIKRGLQKIKILINTTIGKFTKIKYSIKNFLNKNDKLELQSNDEIIVGYFNMHNVDILFNKIIPGLSVATDMIEDYYDLARKLLTNANMPISVKETQLQNKSDEIYNYIQPITDQRTLKTNLFGTENETLRLDDTEIQFMIRILDHISSENIIYQLATIKSNVESVYNKFKILEDNIGNDLNRKIISDSKYFIQYITIIINFINNIVIKISGDFTANLNKCKK